MEFLECHDPQKEKEQPIKGEGERPHHEHNEDDANNKTNGKGNSMVKEIVYLLDFIES